MIVPGQSLPTGESSSSGTATAARVSPSSTAAAVSDGSTSSHVHLSSGAIAGIAVGAVVVAALIGFLLFLLGRHHTEIRFLRRDVHVQRHSQLPASPAPMYEYSRADLQRTPGLSIPYDSEDLKGRNHQDAAPPYSQPTEHPQPVVAELPSPLIGTNRGRHGSPPRELGAQSDTVTAAQRNVHTQYGSASYGGGGGGDSGASSDSS